MLLLLCFCATVHANPYLSEKLLFVGEDNQVLTIATGKPQLPYKAPAVADVITDRQMQRYGFRTLGEVLSTVPGFSVLPLESAYSLFLRGIRSGALLLYDGVPLTTDSTKAIYPLGDELSLDQVKRIEVVRGSGSVLWGPDAFAGVINIVPKRGRDFSGLQMKVMSGTPDGYRGLGVSFGKDFGLWDVAGFLSYKRKESFLGGLAQEFWEGGFNLYVMDSLQVCARLSSYRRPYRARLKLREGEVSWTSRKDVPFSLFKVEYKKGLGSALFKLKGAFSQWNITQRDGKYSYGYRDRIYLLEGMVTKELFDGKGLLTVGASIRRNFAKNAVVNVRSFIPEYLAASVPVSPLVDKRSFDTTLYSAFAQYVHRWKAFEAWAGARVDKHSDYESKVSYTVGLGFYPSDRFSLKVVGGTSYRTPYASQFLRNKVSPEKLTSVSAEVRYSPWKWLSLKLMPFYNDVERHVSEDSYMGYSRPADYSTWGTEFRIDVKRKKLEGWFDITYLNRNGGKEKFKVLDYIIITPESMEAVYSYYSRRVEIGPRIFSSFGVSYESDKQTVGLKGVYLGPIDFPDVKYEGHVKSSPQLLVDLFLERKITDHLSLTLKLENLLDTREELEGRYIKFKRPGTYAYLYLNYKF